MNRFFAHRIGLLPVLHESTSVPQIQLQLPVVPPVGVAPDVDGAASPGADLSIERPRPNAPSDALERLLATRFATLGDTIRAPPNERNAIERCVDSLERANPTRAPATSPAQTGDWTLRYTTSVGTMASVATWETVAGAVTDVSQRVDAAPERRARRGEGAVNTVGAIVLALSYPLRDVFLHRPVARHLARRYFVALLSQVRNGVCSRYFLRRIERAIWLYLGWHCVWRWRPRVGW